jgi:hypothetical protein
MDQQTPPGAMNRAATYFVVLLLHTCAEHDMVDY